MKKNLTILFLVCATIGVTLMQRCKPTKPLVTKGQIRGYVFASVRNTSDDPKKSGPLEQIFIPDVLVVITDSLGNPVDSTMSGLDGGYVTEKKIPFGNYTINFRKKGFVNTTHNIHLITNLNYPGPLPINYDMQNYVWGTALLLDKSSGYYKQDVFNVAYDTKIVIGTDSNSAVRCNIYGYYLTTYSPAITDKNMIATCQSITAGNVLASNPRVDFTFKNSNPHIPEIRAFDNRQFIQRTHTGATIKLIAVTNDADNDVLAYSWKIGGTSPTAFTTANNDSVMWTVPGTPGLYTIDVMALDNKGGAAYSSYAIEVGDEQVSFSGNVTDIMTHKVIDGATVTVAGVTVLTDALGNFNIKVPQSKDTNRYVLNIEKLGYCLKSKIYFKDAVGIPYKLVPSYTETFDPKTDITLVERPDNFSGFTQIVTTRDKNNKIVRTESKRVAALVKIPANSIVNARGEKVTNDVTVSIRAIDIFNDEGMMPGDFGGIQGGKQVRLETFGAVDVQIRDKADPTIKYNLDRSATAEVGSPIASYIKSGATRKGSITLWDYNDKTGAWEDIGTLANKGDIFVGKTNRFSVLNADDAFGAATMMRLIDNPNNQLPTGNIQIQLFAPNVNGGADFKHQITINRNIAGNLPVYVPRLAPNKVYTITVIQNGIVLNNINAQTKGVVAGAELWDPNVTNSNYQGLSSPEIIDVPLLPDLITNLSNDQLNRFLTQVSNDAVQANKYYELIGAMNSSGTPLINFTQWKNNAGFPASGSGDYNAVYYNNGDLRFWRSMHQKTNGAGVISYYVTNYNNEVDAINNTTTGAIATVCMEYSPIVAGGNPVTKFYVFDGATGNLLNSANLDQNTTTTDGSNGQKFIPGLCITCHGGEFLTNYTQFPNAAALQTRFDNNPREIPKFIAFDVKSYFFSQIAGATRIDQEENFRNLNRIILNTNPTTAITEHINASYNSNVNTAGQKYVDNAFVTGWNSTTAINGVVPKEFYYNVLGPSCRTCHNSRSNDDYWFNTQTKFTDNGFIINLAVCAGTPTRYMPNSKVTFLNFWTSENPRQYDQLRGILGASVCPTCNRP